MAAGKKVCITVLVLVVVNIVEILGYSRGRVTRSIQPDLFPTCKRGSDEIGNCVKNATQVVLGKLKNGYPSLKIQSCEPLSIDDILLIKDGEGRFNISMLFKDIKLAGFTTMVIQDVVVDPDLTEFKIKLHADEVIMSANYEFSGHILSFPIHGANNFSATSTNLNSDSTIKTKKVERDGREYLSVDSVLYPINIGNVKFNFQGLNFGGIVDINELLDQNWRLVNDDMSVLFEAEMANAIKRLANKFFDNYSIDEIFPS